MLFDRNNNTMLITQDKSTVIELVKKLHVTYPKFENNNVIINLSVLNKVAVPDIIEFLEISNKHRGFKHSFVIVTNQVDLDEMPDEIVVVPTLEEAYDVIDMEEMERDLGI